MNKKPYRYTEEEREFIRENWISMTDEKIAEKLGRSSESIKRKRDDLGLKKPGGRPSNIYKEKYILENPTKAGLEALSKEKRLKYLKENFDKSIRYTQIVKELDADEIEYYKFKYIEFVEGVVSITTNEEDMLHHMIISDILIHRLRSTMKREQEEWDQALPGARPPQNFLPELERLENRYMKYHKELNVTREQRLRSEKEEKITIASLVRSYQDKRAREEAGRHAAILEYNRAKCKDDMSKYRYLLGDM